MSFWQHRWETEQTGWHRAVHNDLMVKHWPSIGAPEGCEVLVPLCGKSLDMHWLAEQGHAVVGLELVEQGVKAFFAEAGLSPERTERADHTAYSAVPFTLLNGDVLELAAGTVQADAWYDRAAMIALPDTVRAAYVQQLRQQTKPGAVGLLITFAYAQEEMDGPPFALLDEDVHRYFAEGFEVERLEKVDLDDEKGRGVSWITSSVFKLTRS
jgi:thiopurine S-methyltransferase